MTDRTLETRVRLTQASGLVSIQAHCSVTEAVELMRCWAIAHGRTLNAVVTDVLERSLQFEARSRGH